MVGARRGVHGIPDVCEVAKAKDVLHLRIGTESMQMRVKEVERILPLEVHCRANSQLLHGVLNLSRISASSGFHLLLHCTCTQT